MDGGMMPGGSRLNEIMADEEIEVTQERNQELEKVVVELKDLLSIAEKALEIMRWKIKEVL